MNRTVAVVLATLLVLLGLLPVLFFSAEDESYSVYRPEGYVKTVDELIGSGGLVYDCTSERIEPSGLTSEEQYFFDNSYLVRDVSAWNGGDRRAFFVEREELRGGGCRGRLLRANAGYHHQRLPSYTASGWKGRLFLHQAAASTVLTSRERTIEVVRAPLSHLPLDAQVFEDLWIVPGNPRNARSPKLALKMLAARRAFASLEAIGDAATLEVLQGQPELGLNGCFVRRGTRLRLASGDSLRLHRKATGRSPGYDERFTVDAGERAGLLSFVSTVNGATRRRTNGRRLAMAEDVVRAIDAAVESGDGEKDFDVHLTLDAFHNDLLTRLLEEHVRGKYGDRPLRAAVTLLDPETGRVLAVASYPTPTVIERLDLLPGTDRVTLAQNHNFDLHAVGSAIKPFLAAAALATRPELAGLKLRCFSGGEAPKELLGYPLGEYNLPGDCAAAAPGEVPAVDFQDFLRVSSNRYMLFLGLLAMANWQGGEPAADTPAVELPLLDRYYLAGREHRLRPRLPIVKDASGDDAELGDVADQELFRNLRRLFGVSFDYESGIAAEALEREYWQPVLAQVPGVHEHAENLWAFDAVTPTEVNLAADLVQSFRQDLYTLLLGLGNDRWSNLQLAQAMGRLVRADPDLRAHLVERVDVPRETRDGQVEEETLWSLEDQLREEVERRDEAKARWPLSEENRQLILRGMAAVVNQPGGTARALRETVREISRMAPEGVAYRLFAKTGTPTTDPQLLARDGSRSPRSALKRYPGGVQAQSGVLVLAIERMAVGQEPDHLVLTFYIEGQGGSGEAVALAQHMLRPLVEGHWPQDWLRRQ